MQKKNLKSFLLLQSHLSWFARDLGKTLYARGHNLIKINYYGGDRCFWGKWKSIDFRGTQEDLPEFYQDIFRTYGITDIILFGDCRPVHIPAIKLAEQFGINYYVLEEGYLRPHWITLEWGGMAGNSCLSSLPDWYCQYAKHLPSPKAPEEIGNSMRCRVVNDLINTAAYYAFHPWYKHYKTHRLYGPTYEYLFWIKRLTNRTADRKYAAQVTAQLIANNEKYFVFPLQLDEDMQIRIHSPFGGMVSTIEAIIRSFALQAPSGTKLLIKNHPLDNGIIDYKKVIGEIASRYDVSGRILYIDGGDLKLLKKHALGVVLVNSTSGLAALNSGHPVITLGKAIYDLPGLTFQGKLDDFWVSDFQADQQILLAFQKVLFHDVLVNGSFYTERGIQLAIENSLPRLESHGCPYGELPPSPWRHAPMPQRVVVVRNGYAQSTESMPQLKQFTE
ncbi:MAG: capsule biosynthesis protein [Gammaproteobacteria bacterium]